MNHIKEINQKISYFSFKLARKHIYDSYALKRLQRKPSGINTSELKVGEYKLKPFIYCLIGPAFKKPT